MRFAIVATLFAVIGLSSATMLRDRQLQACPPGRKTYCSMDDCKAACEGCTVVGKDYGGSLKEAVLKPKDIHSNVAQEEAKSLQQPWAVRTEAEIADNPGEVRGLPSAGSTMWEWKHVGEEAPGTPVSYPLCAPEAWWDGSTQGPLTSLSDLEDKSAFLVAGRERERSTCAKFSFARDLLAWVRETSDRPFRNLHTHEFEDFSFVNRGALAAFYDYEAWSAASGSLSAPSYTYRSESAPGQARTAQYRQAVLRLSRLIRIGEECMSQASTKSSTIAHTWLGGLSEVSDADVESSPRVLAH
ncbi:hypothetical protein GGG16DRAFT_99177 [Schizophyllum commune]